MKFSEKYELLESVTKGQMRTFLAREVASRTRVVVHIFDCPGDHSGQMAGQWVLRGFRNLAPNPPGEVLEVGSYEESSYAYLVTRMPDPVALQAWIRAYKMHSGSTEDIRNEVKGDITTGPLEVPRLQENTATAGLTTHATGPDLSENASQPEPPGDFTKAFWDLAGKPEVQTGEPRRADAIPSSSVGQNWEETRPRANARPSAGGDPSAPGQERRLMRSDFTEAFMKLGEASLGQSEQSSRNAGGLAASSSPQAFKDKPGADAGWQRPARPEPGAFTKEFLSVLDADLKRSTPTPTSQIEDAKPQSPGAFTREFLMATGTEPERGPAPSRAAKVPPAQVPTGTSSSDALSAYSGSAPSFTGMFRSGDGESKMPIQPANAPIAENKGATAEFSSFFGGPFQAPAASEVPVSFPDPLTSLPAKKEPGDFTRLFGSLRPASEPQEWPTRNPPPVPAEKAEPTLEPAEPATSGPGLLSFARKAIPNLPAAGAGEEFWGGNAIPAAAPATEKRDIFPATGAVSARPSSGAGATQVFVQRGSEISAPAMASGPSEFTRIVSGTVPGPIPSAEPPINASGTAGRFSMPSISPIPSPQIPGMQAPQMPAMQPPMMPQASGMGMPQMPGMSMPQMPQSPPLPKAPGALSGGKTSYLPLIIIFNVLFIIAVLIVLYFVFKH